MSHHTLTTRRTHLVPGPAHRRALLYLPLLCFGGAVTVLPGCASQRPPSPYLTGEESGARNPVKAQELAQRGADLLESDPVRAESLLREALTADLYHGPAHNNLGVLLLKRGELYAAAEEFQWARTLMPGHPDPRVNLALTFEKAGRFDDGLRECRTALEVRPGHLAAVQQLAKLQRRLNHSDAQTADLLRDIALRGDQTWRDWAQLQLAILEGRPARTGP